MPTMNNKRAIDIGFFLLFSLMGVAVVSAAPHITGSRLDYPAFLPWMRAGVEGFSKVSALGLFIVGFLAGAVRRDRPWLWGMATMALYPVWAVVEMTLDPKSHNLWPLEFICYAVESLVAVVGAFIGARLSRILIK